MTGEYITRCHSFEKMKPTKTKFQIKIQNDLIVFSLKINRKTFSEIRFILTTEHNSYCKLIILKKEESLPYEIFKQFFNMAENCINTNSLIEQYSGKQIKYGFFYDYKGDIKDSLLYGILRGTYDPNEKVYCL